MVLIDGLPPFPPQSPQMGKKFACAACIKGHRSSSCHHIDRTLLEIGKKGRPPTQCAHCRELRRVSKVHSKCMCGDRPVKRSRNLTVLPLGLKSLPSSSSPQSDDQDSSVNQQPIINPCSCSSGGQCCCSAPPHPTTGTRAKQNRDRPPPTLKSPTLPDRHHDPFVIRAVDPVVPTSISPPSLPSCCSRPPPPQHGSVSPPPPPESISFHSYPRPNTLSPPALRQPFPPAASSSNSSPTLELNPRPNQPAENHSMSDALFAPRTAGTALCFCGIHCPCPGCVLHDPLGLKFPSLNQSNSLPACPTSLIKAEGCIAGLDLPTVNRLLDLSPITDSFASPSTIQLPSLNQTMGWSPPPLDQHPSLDLPPVSSNSGCCGGGGSSEPVNVGNRHFTPTVQYRDLEFDNSCMIYPTSTSLSLSSS